MLLGSLIGKRAYHISPLACRYAQNMILMNPYRSFMRLNTWSNVHMLKSVNLNTKPFIGSQISTLMNPNPFSLFLTPGYNFSHRDIRTKRKMLRNQKVKKHKMKTHKGAAKRFFIIGRSFRSFVFRFKSSNARHLMRNKSRQNKMKKRRLKTMTAKPNIRRLKILFPYYKKMRRSMRDVKVQ